MFNPSHHHDQNNSPATFLFTQSELIELADNLYYDTLFCEFKDAVQRIDGAKSPTRESCSYRIF